MRKRSDGTRSAVSNKPKKTAKLSHDANMQGLTFLKTELDLSFTFITLAITAYASGSLDHARQAANDARKGYQGAEKQLAKSKMSPKQRQEFNQRLKNLQQALATLEAKDPGALHRQPAAEVVHR